MPMRIKNSRKNVSRDAVLAVSVYLCKKGSKVPLIFHLDSDRELDIQYKVCSTTGGSTHLTYTIYTFHVYVFYATPSSAQALAIAVFVSGTGGNHG